MQKEIADRIISEYLQKIYGFSVKKSYSFDEAEELCAEIVKEVYLSLLRTNEIENIEGYIWRISAHTYAKFVSSKRKHEGISIDGLPIPYFETFLSDDTDEEIRKLRREVGFLTEKRRRIIYRFYYENRTIASIAEEMALPEGTIKWHLNKARIELKEGFGMERKIGKLGLSPVEVIDFGHSGGTGSNNGPEFYLGDKINLNIVYSVYEQPLTKAQIAEELGMTLVFLEDKISFLEENGFLVKTKGDRYTTYVDFFKRDFTQQEKKLRAQKEVAKELVKDYVPYVRNAIADFTDVYIPGGNRELLEAAAIYYGISNKSYIPFERDLSPYAIYTTAGGAFYATIYLKELTPQPMIDPALYRACGSMFRVSEKYPGITAWSVDTRYDSRKGGWKNNLTSDYEYLYEHLTGKITADSTNAEKYARLNDRCFLSDDGSINIMLVKGKRENFWNRIPSLNPEQKAKYTDIALEYAALEAKLYPPQMQDLIFSRSVTSFIGNTMALMVLDELYGNGTFKPLTEQEKVTANLLMFSDTLPNA